MMSFPVLDDKPLQTKPDWFRIRAPKHQDGFDHMRNILRSRGLVTVCEESHCPNQSECWTDEGTATFMVMGDTCTRGCRFCAVKTARHGKPLDPDEPRKLADAIAAIGLDYAVITSVDRDDLPDQGAGHFASCIREIKRVRPSTLVEVLIPDFQGNKELIDMIVRAKPEVIAHNIETVRRLTPKIRDRRAGYDQSLSVLKHIKRAALPIITKSSIIVGFGETREQVLETMRDLRNVGVDIVTIGQYLKPRTKHLPVKEWVHPSTFAFYKHEAMKMGFKFCAAGPLVRSSYKAGELFVKHILGSRNIYISSGHASHHG